ncbi:nucleoside transporter [Parapedobacter composti]|uniref:Nucleoside transporter n=1 Tax=Parapedobacter composti TaxID=623281 RepID=A0A1I1KCZ0_9SPHI|nr:nucleoside permease [Parapedobacter composti]SFC58834.1 nucleoside transporter [Parapedobacter composti]
MKKELRGKLSLVMFLEYFTWGTWYVTLGTFLMETFQASAAQVGSAYANLSIAAAVSPIFVGMVADRYFSAQKVLGTLHLAGAVVLMVLGQAASYGTFWWLLLLYTMLYMPTMALVNAITFRQLDDDGKTFPYIRVFGTVGWIAVGLLIGSLNLESSRMIFNFGAAASLLLGVVSFTLPDTPPVKTQSTDILSLLGGEALVLFRKWSFVVFFLSSLAICIPLSFYYSFANPFLNDVGMANAAGKMTLGQVSEFLFLLVIPLAFRKFGIKAMLAVGIIAWIVRYVLFAYGGTDQGIWMLYAGILLHGVCYDFFFVTGQLYVDNVAGKSIRNAAQGLITFATYGVGMLIGSHVAGLITARYARQVGSAQQFDWQGVWLVPAAIALVVLVLFIVLFRDPGRKTNAAGSFNEDKKETKEYDN